MQKIRRIALLGVATLAAAFWSVGAGTATASAERCGWDPHLSGIAYYNHCTNDGSVIEIRVQVALAPDYNRCANPGHNALGSTRNITYAYYTGRLC
jgi:hypothetical protein